MNEFTPPGGEPPRPEPRSDPWQRAGYSSYGSGPYEDTATAFARARTSKKMAGWGLALSLLICVPFAPLVGLSLGIAVLVRAKDGRDHGRGMGIAAVVIGGLYLLSVVAIFAWGIVTGIEEELAGPERDGSGRLEESGEIYADDLRVGDCVSKFERAEEIPAGEEPTGLVTVVRCDSLHLAEVYHVFHLDPGAHRDQASLDLTAERGCVERFEAYVGTSYFQSTLELNYYSPNKEGGLLGNDDRVICLVTAPALTGRMLEGSGR